jgi:uncharacterized protein (TIGR00369 family)
MSTDTTSRPSGPPDLAKKSGLEVMRAVLLNRERPPGIGALIGMIPVEVEEGRVAFDLEPRAELYNPLGSVHGGVSATLLDSAMSCAVHTMLPPGASYTTLEIKVNYVRAITAEVGTVHCTGSVVHLGGRIATAEGRITDDSGRLLAHATTTCIVFR